MSPNCSASHSANVTHSPYARAPDLTVTLSRIAVQFLTLIFHQHTEAKDVITSKSLKLPGIFRFEPNSDHAVPIKAAQDVREFSRVSGHYCRPYNLHLFIY
jgi:hypothetical protein